MTTVMITHEVDDVDHWLTSPVREQILGPMGITVRTFVDPNKTNHVGLVAEIPDLDAFHEMLSSEAAAEAMKYDGVHPETIAMLVAS